MKSINIHPLSFVLGGLLAVVVGAQTAQQSPVRPVAPSSPAIVTDADE